MQQVSFSNCCDSHRPSLRRHAVIAHGVPHLRIAQKNFLQPATRLRHDSPVLPPRSRQRSCMQVHASSQQESRRKPQGFGLMRIPGPWWLLAAVLPATGVIGMFTVGVLFGTLGLVSALLWACGALVTSLLGVAIFAPWLILAASFTAAFTLPLTAAVGFFLYKRVQKAKLAQEMQERKATSETAAIRDQPVDEEQQEAARLAQELRDFDSMLGRRR